ncbi:capsular polysaccharide biosynthesis protein [Jannaschia pagri]|uniref:Capsular polysaccharide biosynthesis protein n=1 Tax=Jannaschia pagri TaxID=2829797 RepID=A0ABQ4NIF9_9RHOB|nr:MULTISPECIES: CapA family protein [unclassified Jannaschia]GIT89699.1 capsular polysaccharide biosynthesis protein [Jannaschia sp. AI_61]GIT94193.1 capsular polysaccharide biosynthesis protein [Jannaschia sp. AI_62]
MTISFRCFHLIAAFVVGLSGPAPAQELLTDILAPPEPFRAARQAGSIPLGREIVIGFGGDVNFARSRQNPSPTTVTKFARLPIASVTETLAAEISGDINFVNVETVVSTRNGTPSGAKAFVFRSHPEQFRHLMKLGVNAFALANNHAYDHGRVGMRDTLDFFQTEDGRTGPLLYAGVGYGADALAPAVITHDGIRIALSAVSFGSGSFGPAPETIGMAYFSVAAQYNAVLRELARVDADLKILSIHAGAENVIALNARIRQQFRRAVEEAGVHLVLGHHPHVVRAVERDARTGAAIFHSLGNLLFIGGAGKDGDAVGRDYGLWGRAYFTMTADGMRATALEAVPLKGVHNVPRHPRARRASAILNHLNNLSRRGAGAAAVTFATVGETRPRGLACFPEEPFGPRARALCCAADSQCAMPDPM